MTRAVAVAHRFFAEHSMALTGLVLVSSVLDFGTQHFGIDRWDESCIGLLPTYAAIASYHGVVIVTSVPEHAAAAEEWAQTTERQALARGRDLPADERAAVVTRMAELTGPQAPPVRGGAGGVRPAHEQPVTADYRVLR